MGCGGFVTTDGFTTDIHNGWMDWQVTADERVNLQRAEGVNLFVHFGLRPREVLLHMLGRRLGVVALQKRAEHDVVTTDEQCDYLQRMEMYGNVKNKLVIGLLQKMEAWFSYNGRKHNNT